MRSNLFANIEKVFATSGKEELVDYAISAACELLEALDDMGTEAKFMSMIIGARLGVAGDGVLSLQEKEMIKEVFGKLVDVPIETIYEAIGKKIEDSDYELVEKITMLGNSVAMPLLHFTLSFAYIDGKIEDDVAKRLDETFGMNLLMEFLESGQEEVPSQGVLLEGLEADIVNWFEEDDTLHSLKEIKAHFPNSSEDEIMEALDSLSDKGVIYGGANIVGNMYGLA